MMNIISEKPQSWRGQGWELITPDPDKYKPCPGMGNIRSVWPGCVADPLGREGNCSVFQVSPGDGILVVGENVSPIPGLPGETVASCRVYHLQERRILSLPAEGGYLSDGGSDRLWIAPDGAIRTASKAEVLLAKKGEKDESC